MYRSFFIVAMFLANLLSSQEPNIYKMEPLSMKDCLLQAIQNNLELEAEGLNPKIRQFDLEYAESSFEPSANSSFLIGEVENEIIRARADGSLRPDTLRTRNISWQVGVTKPHVLGGTLALTYEIGYSKSVKESQEIRNPAWGHEIHLKATQPLLRNLGIAVNTASIRIAENELTSSYYAFEDKAIDVLASVQSAYWDLVNAIANYELQRKSLEQAENLYKITLARIKAGSLAQADILDAERSVASKQDYLVVSERNIYEAEDRLKQLIRPLDVAYYKNVRLLPTERIVFHEFDIDFDTILKEAMSLRPDIKAADLSLKNADLNIMVAKNQLLPQLNISGDIGLRGQGRVSSEAWDGMKDSDQLSWNIQLSLDIPLGNRAAKSRYEQALLQQKQLELQRKSLDTLVILEVRSATRQLETSMHRVKTARKTRELAEKQLANEENKFRAGIIALFQVQDTEEKLTEARISESNALADYQQALVQMERVKATLLPGLHRYNIQMPLPTMAKKTY